jgi:fumarate hydratase class I
MDSYVDLLQSHGASMIMLAKGNRSQQVTDACHKHGGFYLGSIGGPAAVLAQNSIKSLECVAYPELGMEAIWKIEWRTSRRLSWWMTKATISSSRSRTSSAQAVHSADCFHTPARATAFPIVLRLSLPGRW